MMDHLDAQLDAQRAAAPRILDADVIDVLRSIGVHDPVYEDPFHRRLVDAVESTRHDSWGKQLEALRFAFNAEQLKAGQEAARATTEYQHQIDRRTVALVAPADGSKGDTRALAEQKVRAMDDMYELQLTAVLAEKREQSMRKYLDSIGAAMETWRTNRADERAGDRGHASGIGGAA